ncbi:unnamed protein product [Zymoseptoria tritici ST99CH_3D1]|uniref:Uncharacterized protein n=1 Tax=Zymoseptoria tritici ST99CH_1E4 TaxID=1276532 RepID=A0A2H1FNP1_ZYMTR|nr:unnamed protein product [Zymoseptoria tritici ST99CH_1E4]SMR45105.1 unnamed protein product [Zymoseptoria tritici ST99CH_3D1]
MAQPARKKQRTTSSVKSLSHSQSPTTITATDPSSDDQIKTSESQLPSEGSDHDAQTQPFRFLDLSPELRINIYEFVASAQSPIILSNKGHLQVDSRLCSVSRQVRSEYLSVFEDAPEITTVVPRFNFGPTISFINRLSEERVNKFSSFSKSPIKRTINIRLLLPGYVSRYERAESQQFQGFLVRWLNRFKKPAKRGVNMNFTYKFVAPFHRRIANVCAISYALELLIPIAEESTGRSREEVLKIIFALSVLITA